MDKKQGFTLIELSIVIIIIGLIVAGVVGGQSLVQGAKLRTIMKDVEAYTAANQTFYLEYNEYAGDMLEANSQAYWGVSGGNGNRKIQSSTEGIRTWLHLKSAGYIEGGYDGALIDDEIPGMTVGLSNYASNAGFLPSTLGEGNNKWGYGANTVYDRAGETVFFFGKVEPTSARVVSYAVLTPSDAANLDEKYDDGEPHLGRVMADHGSDVGSGADQHCVSRNQYATAAVSGDLDYRLDHDYEACRMIFVFR